MTPDKPRIALMLDLRWPYKRHTEVYSGAQTYAKEHGWFTVIDEFPHRTLGRPSSDGGPYTGIIARANGPLARVALQKRVPVVNVWPSSPVRHKLPGVFPDSTATGQLLAEHLMSRGFRGFATITSSESVDNELEVAEFNRVVQAAGFETDSVLIPQTPEADYMQWRTTERLLNQAMDRWKPPIGVYVGQEMTGRMVVQLCQQRGWNVPGDVAIIAGKNQEALCEQPRPTLTSVEIGYDEIGYRAAALLDELMAGGEPPSQPIRIPPRGLIVRESTDFYAVKHDIVAAALAYISSHSHRTIGPEDVASAVGVETRTLQNYFQKTIQRPIATEIRRVRIERAKRELIQSDRPLDAIARDVGFGGIQRLCDVFRREMGISPNEFRKQRQPRRIENPIHPSK